jgi:hypothetical protein
VTLPAERHVGGLGWLVMATTIGVLGEKDCDFPARGSASFIALREYRVACVTKRLCVMLRLAGLRSTHSSELVLARRTT